jgi:hypothetical protein
MLRLGVLAANNILSNCMVGFVWLLEDFVKRDI